MLILGLLTHFFMILSEMSSARKSLVTPWGYVKERPYKAALSVIGSIVAYSLLPEGAEPYVVFGAGYMANDALDRLGTITNKSMIRPEVGENEALDRPSEVLRE